MSESNGDNPHGEPGQANNPDPYGGAPQSNPYGAPAPNPYQPPVPPVPPVPPSPYAAPPANPYAAPQQYGAPPQFGAPPPYGQGTGPKKTDGMAIGALISSVIGLCTCIGSIVGIVLGFIAMSRTKDGRAAGRGLAITGVVLGFVGILIWIIGIVALVVVGVNTVVTPGNAKVGQCVDVDKTGDKISMTKKSCTERHDAEIVGVGKVTSDNLDQARTAQFCQSLISVEDQAKLLPRSSELTFSSVTENPDDMQAGDHVVCYVESDTKLTDDVLK